MGGGIQQRFAADTLPSWGWRILLGKARPSEGSAAGVAARSQDDGVCASWGQVRLPRGSQACLWELPPVSGPCPALVLTAGLGPCSPWCSLFPSEDLLSAWGRYMASPCGTPWMGPESPSRHALQVGRAALSSLTSVEHKAWTAGIIHESAPRQVRFQAGTHLTWLAGSAAWMRTCGTPPPQIPGGSAGDKAPPMMKPDPFSHAAS